MRDPDQARFKRIKVIANEATTTEIETATREMKTKIRTYEDDYGASSPEELARELAPDNEQGWDIVSMWKTTRQNLSFAKTALAFKETRTIDAMTGDITDGVAPSTWTRAEGVQAPSTGIKPRGPARCSRTGSTVWSRTSGTFRIH